MEAPRLNSQPQTHLLASGKDIEMVLVAIARLDAKLDVALPLIRLILKGELAVSKELDTLSAEVSQADTVMASAVALIQGLAVQIANAGTDPQKLQALTVSLTNSANSLAAAVAANTAAGNEPPPDQTPVPVPSIASISPVSGAAAGGDTVTITGAGLTGATGVSFGNIDAASFSVDSDTQITAVSPAEAAGSVNIVVTGPGGASTQVPSPFTFA